MRAGPTVTITVNVPVEVKAKAKEEAAIQRRTLSSYVLCLVEADLIKAKRLKSTK